MSKDLAKLKTAQRETAEAIRRMENMSKPIAVRSPEIRRKLIEDLRDIRTKVQKLEGSASSE